jgi:hypothetical protein
VSIALTTSFFAAHFSFPPYLTITTLCSYGTTRFVLFASTTIVTLLVLDLLQFIWLWDELRGLLRALNRESFRRSFVPIEDFKWRNLWSFSGVSFRDQRVLYAAQIDCVVELSRKHGLSVFALSAFKLDNIRMFYNTVDLDTVTLAEHALNTKDFFDAMKLAGREAATLVASQRYSPLAVKLSNSVEAIQRSLGRQGRDDGGRFSNEAEELARIPEWQQASERLLCLMFIAFIQTIVARLHSLLVSVASLFSLITMSIAIYPFVPFYPLLLTGISLLLAIGWGFYKVFSEMDTDPILSRIVNGDDRKLQGSFYLKFTEALALPLLTLGSSILPGGAGRILELAQSLFNHSQ